MGDLIAERYKKFNDLDENAHYLERFIKPHWLLCWSEDRTGTGMYNYICQGIKVSQVDIDVLQEIGVWNKLSEEVQKTIVNREEADKENSRNKMAHARGKKKKKYPNIPKEMTCSKCKAKETVVPSLVAKKVDKLGILLDDYIKNFECRTCNPPRRGRKKDPANVLTDLICKCGFKVSYPLNMIKKNAEKKGMTVEDFIKGYACQSCKPWRKKRK